MKNFTISKNKLGRIYDLTLSGISEKAVITYQF